MNSSSTISSDGTDWTDRQLFIAAAAGCCLAVTAGVAPLPVWGALVALCLLVWLFLSPLNGMTLVVGLSVFIVRSTEEFTVFEAAYAVLITTIMSGWLAGRLIRGAPLGQTGTDRLLIGFIGVCLLTCIPALGYGTPLYTWMREFEPLIFYLVYLLFITSIRSVAQIKRLCLAFVILTLGTGIVNIIEYRENVMNARYLWELAAGRRAAGEPLFFATLTVTLIMVAFKGWRSSAVKRVNPGPELLSEPDAARALGALFSVWRTPLLIGLAVFCAAALAITFSRGYWVACALALVTGFVLMTTPARRRLILYLTGPGILAGVTVFLFMGPVFLDVLSALGERLASISGASVDLSLKNRWAESAGAFQSILNSPVWGYGFGYVFSYDHLLPPEAPTWYAHNGFLYLWLKTGAIGLGLFLAWYLTVLVHGYRIGRKTDDPFLKPLITGVTSVMIAMLPLSITSPQFIQKDSILFLTIGMAVIELAYHNRLTSGKKEGDTQ
jgi:O-antigen ligase